MPSILPKDLGLFVFLGPSKVSQSSTIENEIEDFDKNDALGAQMVVDLLYKVLIWHWQGGC